MRTEVIIKEFLLSYYSDCAAKELQNIKIVIVHEKA